MLNHFLDNLANILFLYLILNQIDEIEGGFHPQKRIFFDLARILSISLLVAFMFKSFQFEGYFFDQRMLPLFLLAYLRGYRIAIPVLFIVTFYRFTLGGGGLIPGVFFGILTPTVIGLIAYSSGLDFFNRKHFYPLLIINWVLSFGTVVILPDGPQIVREVLPSHLLIYLLAGLGLHKLFGDQLKRRLSDLALRETEEQLEKVIGIIPDILLIVQRNGEILFASPSSKHLFSKENHERLIGSSVFDYMDERSLPLLKEKILLIDQGKEPELAELLLRKEGKLVSVEMNGRKIHYGGIEAILLVFRDITERKKTEEELRNLDKLSTVGQLAASIAHEIRNPLTSLKGFLQLIEQGGDAKRYIPIMMTELERINQVTSEMLLLSKPQTIQFKDENLSSLLEEVTAFLRSEGNLKGVDIHFIASSPDLTIKCDPNQLKQLFINLIKNAMDATPNGGVIQLTARPKGDTQVEVIVKDDGIGIPEEILSQLGKPFYTTKEKGTGLGLTVCNQIIQSHQGKISFDSTPGKGTTVTVTLPKSLPEEI